MKKLLLATAATIPLLLALAAPAHAVLAISFHDTVTNTTQTIVDGGFGDLAGPSKNLITLNTVVGGFTIFGTASFSSSGNISMSSFGILNGGVQGTLEILVGDNGFASPIAGVNESGALTFHNNVGATASTLQFFLDPTNLQPTFPAHGGLLFTAAGTPTAVDDSFSGTNFSPFIQNTPFSMAELARFNMINGATITGFEQSMTTNSRIAPPVPEPSTWALMLIGFAGLAWAGMRKRRYSREWHGGEYVAQSPMG